MIRSFGQWARGTAAVALAVFVAVGVLAAPAFGAGYQLNGLGAGCTEPGNSNTVRGNMFEPGSDVSIVLGSQQIGITTADDAGNVDASFVVPAGTPNATTTLKLVGASTDGARTISFELKVGDCSETEDVSPAAASGGGTGALAFTGGNVGLTVGIGAAVLVVGVALVAAARRKRSPHDAA